MKNALLWIRRAAPLAALTGLLGLGPAPALALEVDETSLPRIAVEGEFFGTLDYTQHWAGTADGAPVGEDRTDFRPNTDDSSVTFTLDKPLYQGSRVGGVVLQLGLEEEAVVPRASAFFGGPRYRFQFGQMALRNTLVRFPTIRDDDLLPYTHVLNGSLGLAGSEGHLYGEAVVLDYYFRPAPWRLALWSQERAQTERDAASGDYVAAESARTNSAGLLLAYDVPEATRYEHRLRRLGVLVDGQRLERRDGETATQQAVVVGGVVGLNDYPEFPWELAFQVMQTGGLADRDASGAPLAAQSEDELAREAATAAVLGLHYAHRTNLQTRWRAGLTLAQKSFPDLDRASQWSVVPSFFKRVGNGVDLVAQAAYTAYAEGLSAILGRERTLAVQVGLTLELEGSFNDTVVDPGSILELEHGRLFRGF